MSKNRLHITISTPDMKVKKVDNEWYPTTKEFMSVYGDDTLYQLLYVNNVRVGLEYGIELKDGDIVVLVQTAQGLSALATMIVKFLVSTAVSWAIGKLFAPKQESFDGDLGENAESVYDISTAQNKAKRGAPIPMVYGRIRRTPDLIAPPHYFYDNGEEYVCMLMSVALGTRSVEEIFVSNTPITSIDPNLIQTKVLHRADYTDKLDTLDPMRKWVELTKQLPNLDMLEIKKEGDTARKYPIRLRGNMLYLYEPYPQLDLTNGAKLTIGGSLSGNDGTYTVDSYSDEDGYRAVTLLDASFTDEPTDTPKTVGTGFFIARNDDGEGLFYTYDENEQISKPLDVRDGTYFYLHGTESNDAILYQAVRSEPYRGTIVNKAVNEETTYQTYSVGVQEVAVPLSCVSDSGAIGGEYYGYEFETYTKHHDRIQAIEIDVILPNGLYTVDGDTLKDHTVEFEFTICRNGQQCATYTETLTAKTRTAIRKTYRYSLATMIQSVTDTYDVKIRRITPNSTELGTVDQLYVKRMKGLYGFERCDNFPEMTLLWVKARASNALSQISQFSINCIVSNTNDTLFEVVNDIYAGKLFGLGLNSADLVFDEHAKSMPVNCVFDRKMTAYDAFSAIAESIGYLVYPMQSSIVFKLDEKREYRSALFNESNIIPDTLEFEYTFKEDDTDGITVQLYDKNLDYSVYETTYPVFAVNPKRVPLFAVTDIDIAKKMAVLMWNRIQYRRSIVRFDTDIQGYIPEYGSRIGVTHNFHTTTMPSRVEWNTNDTMQLVDNIEYDGDVYVFVRNADGTIYEAGKGIAKSKGLDSTVIEGMVITQECAGLNVAICDSYTQVLDYLITSISPKSDGVFTIEAIEYDERVYNVYSYDDPTYPSDPSVPTDPIEPPDGSCNTFADCNGTFVCDEGFPCDGC